MPVTHLGDGEVLYTLEDSAVNSAIRVIPRRAKDGAIVHIQIGFKGKEPLKLTIGRPSGNEVMGISVTLSGASSIDFDDKFAWRYLKDHCTLTATHARGTAAYKINPGEKYDSIAFTYSREERLATFKDIQLPPELAGLASEHFESRLTWQTPTPPLFLRIARETLTNPYRGAAKQFFLESKSLELLSALAALFDQEKREAKESINEHEMALLREIRDTLQSRYDNPPSLLELASHAGMNHNKLNQKFRLAFGATMGAFLQDYRLEQGRIMLGKGQGVKETATTLGYRHSSNFITAYRRKFGVSPGAGRKSTV